MRLELIERMIKLYGLKNEITQMFIDLCEAYENNDWNDKVLSLLVEAHEENPQ